MIDFENAKLAKLRPVSINSFKKAVSPLLACDEEVVAAFQGIRDGAIFTNKRLIVVNVQGITGMKKDFTSLPYKRVQAFSVETAGFMDIDCELILWFSGLGQVNIEFLSCTDIAAICRIISERAL